MPNLQSPAMPSKIERIQHFIHDFQALRTSQRGRRLVQMRDFFTEFERRHQQAQGVRAVMFNVFSLLNVEADEVRHSQVLAWLLDAKGGHGQGTRFFHTFVKICGLDIPTNDLNRYRVRTEFVGRESIIDIMAYRRGKFLIYLENKVFSPEGPDQIAREFRDMRRRGQALRVPTAKQFAVFLTPTGRAPTSGDATHWITLSYDDLAVGFSQHLPGLDNAYLQGFLEDWIDTIKRFGG